MAPHRSIPAISAKPSMTCCSPAAGSMSGCWAGRRWRRPPAKIPRIPATIKAAGPGLPHAAGPAPANELAATVRLRAPGDHDLACQLREGAIASGASGPGTEARPNRHRPQPFQVLSPAGYRQNRSVTPSININAYQDALVVLG